MTSSIVQPGKADDFVAAGSEGIGGPMGRYAHFGGTWWIPVRVLIVLATLTYAGGYLIDQSCRRTGWASPEVYEHLCYSDIPPLFGLRGFAEGLFPYLQAAPGQTHLEYPVVTGIFMQIAAMVTRAITGVFPQTNPNTVFFDVNVVLLFIPLLIAVVATAMTVRRRPWDAAMFALAPAVLLAATINWDLLPLAFTGIALVLWARNHPFSAGLLLGLGVAAKFYPLLLLGAFLVLSIRTGRWRAFAALVLGTVVSWLVVNLPFMWANFDGWAFFYRFSQTRGEDFGSIWFAFTEFGMGSIPALTLNIVAIGAFLALCAGIAVMALTGPRRPRLAPLMFLILAAFVVTNKVYSPQYALWLIPVAILARPRWRDFLIWQAGEVVYFVAIWWFLVGYGKVDVKGLTPQWYATATLVHIGATIFFAVMVIRDIYHPAHDPIRSDGFSEDVDDPGGGPYNWAPDALVLKRSAPSRPVV